MKKKHFHKSHDHRPYVFPKDFLWGTATSSHQVEGNNINNDWHEWEKTRNNVVKNEKSGIACNHYNQYSQDFDFLTEMNNNVHRLSIEWSRIEPEENIFDDEAINHYKNVLKDLKQRKIKTMVTLHHFTNPIWFSKKGGWENKNAPQLFIKYVEKIIKHLGGLVDFWITINEPMVYISMGYLEGIWPPGKKNILQAISVFRNMTKAHKKSYQLIHKKLPQIKTQVGLAKNIISFEAYHKNSLLDTLYTYGVNKIWNHLFFQMTKNHHDFIGVNYYFHQRLERKRGTLFSLSFSKQIHLQRREITDLGWEVYPAGIFSALMDMKPYNLPIYITENGIATENDNKRIRFILAHLTEINRAINAGVDAKGYIYWSLIDNFEWHLGFTPKFGLVSIDYKTQSRTPKKSATIFKEIAMNNKIEHDLLQYLGHTPHDKMPDVCIRWTETHENKLTDKQTDKTPTKNHP